jgi:hypothetical protein
LSSTPGDAAKVMRALAGVHLFPVRHHSPRASQVLHDWLEQVRPALVLVEGPADAGPVLEVLFDEQTRPPVAILGYRTDGQASSTLYPMASYSPEYVALRWARAHGAKSEFIDITIGQGLAVEAAKVDEGAAEPREEDDGVPGREAETPEPHVSERIAKSRGFRSFEEFWEASFEAPKYDATQFRAALMAYADVVRLEPGRVDFHRARDAFMARRIAAAVDGGVDPARIAVVVGAAHAAAFACGDVDLELEKTLEPTVPTAVTLIPYSFPRLSEQVGYGAGNRAPQYYQRAHDAGCDFRRATLEVLVEFCEHLRLRGFMASLADTIEAYRLACMLAGIRGKTEPGLDEVREAAVATMCRGDASLIDKMLWPTVVGRAVGQVASKIGRNSLQQEFWREVEARRLPRTDEPQSFVLRLNDPVQVETSIFLHRLRVAHIPYANFVGTQAGGRAPAPGTEEAGGHAALARVREGWEAQWTPSTDVALVERIVMGDSLQGVCERTLGENLGTVAATGAAARILMEAVVCSAPEAMARALVACDRHAATDDDLPSLASACRALSGLASYGTSRGAAALGDDVIPALCRKTFDRAVLRVPGGCTGNDESVLPAKEALRTLHEIALTQPVVDKAAWIAQAHALVGSYAVNPGCSGMAAGLLYLAEELDESALALVVGQRLSNVLEPAAAAAFLGGFFEVNALVLVKSRPIVQALDAFLVAIDVERFRDTLPMLRRAFGALGATERRYLLENLLALRKIGAHAAEAKAVIDESDKEKLKAMGADMAKVLDDLDDLL